jgi:hypothetical protein
MVVKWIITLRETTQDYSSVGQHYAYTECCYSTEDGPSGALLTGAVITRERSKSDFFVQYAYGVRFYFQTRESFWLKGAGISYSVKWLTGAGTLVVHKWDHIVSRQTNARGSFTNL